MIADRAHVSGCVDAASQLGRFEIDTARIEEPMRTFQPRDEGNAGTGRNGINAIVHQLHALQRQRSVIGQLRVDHIDIELALRLSLTLATLRQAGNESADGNIPLLGI